MASSIEAPSLSASALHALGEMYAGEPLVGTESADPIGLREDTRISPEQGAKLRQLMIDNSVSRSLEIGFAYGFEHLN
jgi:hypothetical protein